MKKYLLAFALALLSITAFADVTVKTTGAGTLFLNDAGTYTTGLSSGVSDINTLTGSVSILPGSGMTSTTVGNTITLGLTGGGGGSSATYKNTFIGLMPIYLSSTTVQFGPGAISDSGGAVMIPFSGNTNVVFSNVSHGCGFLDTGVPVAGTAYYYYSLSTSTNSSPCIVASTSQTYGGINYTSLASYVGGYVSKIPFADVYHSAGINDFRIEDWPGQTGVQFFDDFDTGGSTYEVVPVTAGTGSFVTTDVYTTKPFCASSQRQATFLFVLKSTSGVGDLVLKLGAGSANTMTIGSILAGGAPVWKEFEMTLTSAGAIQWKAPSGTTVQAFIRSCRQSES